MIKLTGKELQEIAKNNDGGARWNKDKGFLIPNVLQDEETEDYKQIKKWWEERGVDKPPSVEFLGTSVRNLTDKIKEHSFPTVVCQNNGRDDSGAEASLIASYTLAKMAFDKLKDKNVVHFTLATEDGEMTQACYTIGRGDIATYRI